MITPERLNLIDAVLALRPFAPRSRYCDLLDDSSPSYDPGYEAVLWNFLHPAEPAAIETRPAEAMRPELRKAIEAGAAVDRSAETAGVTAGFSYPLVMRAGRLARECPHAEGPPCGCAGVRACKLGKGRGGLVSHGECTECKLQELGYYKAVPALAVSSYCASWTGYGQIAEWVGRGLNSLGVEVAYDCSAGSDEQYYKVSPFVRSRTRSAGYEIPAGAWSLQLVTPHAVRHHGGRAVAMTMWESSRISPDAVRNLNRVAAVFVPCAWNKFGFEASGVTTPVTVVPLGVSAEDGYSPKPLPEGPFTLGMAARMSHGGVRKGVNEGMKAFVRAFPGSEDVRLKVKVWPDCLPYLKTPDDPRVVVETTPMTPPMMADWYGGIHCLLVPSKSEGWGLHSLQAMACGRPLIAARYGGTAEFFDASCGWEVGYREGPAGEFYAGQGDWCVPDEDSMVESMRSAYADRGEAARRGEAAAARASRFTWERTAKGLRDALRAVGALPDDGH